MAPRHRARKGRNTRPVVTGLVVALLAASGVAAYALTRDAGADQTAGPAPEPTPMVCANTLQVVTASSFARVLDELAPTLAAAGDDCVTLQVEVRDGRTAPQAVADTGAHVWIPDDGSWAETAGDLALAEEEGGAGTVVATSPIYMVAGKAAAKKIADAGGSWEALAELAAEHDGVSLVVRDPNGTGDGLIGLGSVAEAVWVEYGMDPSAAALADAHATARTVTEHALPSTETEVGVVPEYVLVRLLENPNRDIAAGMRNADIMAGADHTALLRYTWLPTAAAVADPVVAQSMQNLLALLTGSDADEALAAAGLRRPDGGPPPGAEDLPEVSAAPFEPLGGHAVDHVFAAWYPEDRVSDLLLVTDASTSMEEGDRPPIREVAAGILTLEQLLPDDARVELWEFGSLIDPPRDYRVLVRRGQLDDAQRNRLRVVARDLDAPELGSGLYDTILGAYVHGRDSYRQGVPNHVVVFTDGKNAYDENSITLAELVKGLTAAQDEARRVELSLALFGPDTDPELLEKALEPVGAHVQALTRPEQIRELFIHVAAGGLH